MSYILQTLNILQIFNVYNVHVVLSIYIIFDSMQSLYVELNQVLCTFHCIQLYPERWISYLRIISLYARIARLENQCQCLDARSFATINFVLIPLTE